MRAIALFSVLALAKVLGLATHGVEPAVWNPLVLLWQDVWVALVYAAVDRALSRTGAQWWLYHALVAYAAFNAALVSVLATPLTLPMLRATGTALADSIDPFAGHRNQDGEVILMRQYLSLEPADLAGVCGGGHGLTLPTVQY